jgi:NADH-quinone oxidoreductase subunit J
MNMNADTEPQKSRLVQFAGILSGGILFVVILAALKDAMMRGDISQTSTDIGLIKNLGRTLFTQYVLPFEISSVLFLSAMIGAIVIGKKEGVTVVEGKNPNQN